MIDVVVSLSIVLGSTRCWEHLQGCSVGGAEGSGAPPLQIQEGERSLTLTRLLLFYYNKGRLSFPELPFFRTLVNTAQWGNICTEEGQHYLEVFLVYITRNVDYMFR